MGDPWQSNGENCTKNQVEMDPTCIDYMIHNKFTFFSINLFDKVDTVELNWHCPYASEEKYKKVIKLINCM